MRFASINGVDVEAAQTAPRRAFCGACREEVFLRCPGIVVPHWVHHANSACVHAGTTSPETDWHKDWKSTVPDKYREKSIRRNGKLRRADIFAATRTVIELQHSAIATDEVLSREDFYGKNMFWMFDADGRKRVFTRYTRTYVQPVVPGMTVYHCHIHENIPGLYEANRAKLIDLKEDVIRIIPYHENDRQNFLCHVQDASKVRGLFGQTCVDEFPAVHPFLMSTSPDWAPKTLLRNIQRNTHTSNGKYMTDYCPHGVAVASRKPVVASVVSGQAKRQEPQKRKSYSVDPTCPASCRHNDPSDPSF